MKDRLEARIIVRHRRDAKAEISSYDPHTGREMRTGLIVGPRQTEIDGTILQMVSTFERAGNRVTVKEMQDG